MAKQTSRHQSRRGDMGATIRRTLVGVVLLALTLQPLFALSPLLGSAQASRAGGVVSDNKPARSDISAADSESKGRELSGASDSSSLRIEAERTGGIAPLRGQNPAAPEAVGPGRIIFLAGDVYNGMVMSNTDGTNTVNLTDSGGAILKHPSVSSQTGMIAFDAQNIIFTPPLPDRDRRIFIMNRDGSGVRQITFLPDGYQGDPTYVQDFNPEISPDGTKVAFISARTAGQVHTCTNINATVQTGHEVFVVNVDGTGLRQVTHPKYLDDANSGCGVSDNYAVAWSSDSQQLAVLGPRPYTFKGTTPPDPPPPRTEYFPCNFH